MELFAVVGAFVLAIVTSLVTVLIWGLKQAKQKGAAEANLNSMKRELEATLKQHKVEIDAAHTKIRGEIRPMLEEIKEETSSNSQSIEAMKNAQAELKGDVKSILAGVNGLTNAFSEFKGHVNGRLEAVSGSAK